MKKEIIQSENELMQIIISVPNNTVKLEINATIMDEETDELYVATNKMPTNEVIEARISGWEWEGENVKYRLTDIGKEIAKSREENSND